MRRLVVCADGTWNSSDNQAELTNVALLSGAVRPVGPDGVEQRVFYDPGVGSRGGLLDVLTGGAFGSGLSGNILDCYRFLVESFEPGDELFFFGYSRGAYTVRSLAGLVRNSGILKREHIGRMDQAFALYRDRGNDKHPNGPDARAFRTAYAHESRIRFIGVWDTVGSLGVPTRGPIGMISRRRNGFHDVQLSSHVDNAFHALAIDERRKPFAPTLWEVPDGDVRDGMAGRRVEQRWFAGVHSDVGGGYADRGLSNIPLRWIAERARECSLGLGENVLGGLACDCHARMHDSMSLLFRPFGEHVRRLDAPRTDPRTVHTFEVVDRTAAERHASLSLQPLYEPANCLEYWKQNPDKWDPRRAGATGPPLPSGRVRAGVATSNSGA